MTRAAVGLLLALCCLAPSACAAQQFSLIAGGPPALGNGMPATQSPLGTSGMAPVGLTVNGTKLYLAAQMQHAIRVYQGGVISAVAGTGRRGHDATEDNGPAIKAMLASPTALAVAEDGTIFFTQSLTGAGLRYVTPDGLIHTAASLGSAILASAVDVLATPTALLIADQSGGRVVKCPLPWTGCLTPVVLQTGLTSVTSIALGPDSFVYATLGNRIAKFPVGGGTLETVLAGFQNPRGLTVAPNGDLFVADQGANRVLRVRAGSVTTVLGTGATNTTQQYCAAPPCDPLAQPFTPWDVALAGQTLYVSSAMADGLVAVNLAAAPVATETMTLTPTVATATRTQTLTPLPTCNRTPVNQPCRD